MIESEKIELLQDLCSGAHDLQPNQREWLEEDRLQKMRIIDKVLDKHLTSNKGRVLHRQIEACENGHNDQLSCTPCIVVPIKPINITTLHH